MIELELLGANGDTVVMTDGKGERYSIVVDDALRAASAGRRTPPFWASSSWTVGPRAGWSRRACSGTRCARAATPGR